MTHFYQPWPWYTIMLCRDSDPPVDMKMLPGLTVHLQASVTWTGQQADPTKYPLHYSALWRNMRALRAQAGPWLKTVPGEWTSGFICCLPTQRNPDHLIHCCILGHSLICAICVTFIFSRWAPMSSYEKNEIEPSPKYGPKDSTNLQKLRVQI